MKVKLDENIPGAAAVELRASGHDVATAHDQGMGGWRDDDLWSAIQRENRLLITQDKGFGDLRRYPAGSHCGVLLLRPEKARPGEVVSFLARVVQKVSLDELTGCLAVASARGVRIRRPR